MHRRGVFTATQKWIRQKYQEQEGKSSESTVKRDIRALLDEQKQRGVALIRYIPGDKYHDPNTDKETFYDSKFQNYLLRYSLQAISLAIDTKDDFKNSHEALVAACEQIIAANRFPKPQPVDGQAPPKKPKSVKALEERLSDIQGELLEQMVREKYPAWRIRAEFNKLQTELELRIREVVENLPEGGQNEPLKEAVFEPEMEVITIR